MLKGMKTRSVRISRMFFTMYMLWMMLERLSPSQTSFLLRCLEMASELALESATSSATSGSFPNRDSSTIAP